MAAQRILSLSITGCPLQTLYICTVEGRWDVYLFVIWRQVLYVALADLEFTV